MPKRISAGARRQPMNTREPALPHPVTPPAPSAASEGAHLQCLLSAVVAACQCMVAHRDLYAGLQAAMAQLGRLSGHDRAYVFELVDQQQVCALVAEWDAPGVPRIANMAGLDRFSVADFQEVWAPLLAGEPYQSVTPLKTGPNAALNLAVANRSDVMVPIFVDNTCWGCIGFDNCSEERRYSDDEIQVLRGAAAAVAAAVQRCCAEAQADAAAQRQRQLLAAVNEASAHLVAQGDLQDGLALALNSLRQHTGVDRVFIHRYDSATRCTHFWLESRRADLPPFTDGFGTGPWPDDAFAEVAYPLREGRVYRSVQAERTGRNASANAVIDSGSDVIVPIFVGGQYRACIGFDDNSQCRTWTDSEVAVLEAAAHAVAAALERHAADTARAQAERARTERAEADAQLLRAREGLLQTVTEAARNLLAGDDFDASVKATMALLGTTFQTTRAGLVQHLGPSVGQGNGRWRVTHEWHHARVPAQIGSAAEEGEHPSPEWVAQSRAGEALIVQLGGNLPDFDAGQHLVSAQTILTVPIFVNGDWWGVVGFDDDDACRQWAAHEIAVLRIAASCVGAALERRQAEAQRLAVAEAHTQQAVSLHRLTQGVVRATRELLDSADFRSGIKTWLAHLGEAAQADLAVLLDLGGPDAMQVAGIALPQLGWRRDGEPMWRTPVPHTRDFDSWTTRLMAQESVWASIDELQDPASVRYWQATDCACNQLMPVVLDGAVRFVLCFDWREPRAYSAAAEAVLRTATDSFTAVLQRRRAADSLLAERELRIAVEQGRADEAARHAARIERHSRLLGAVATSAEELLACADPADCMAAVLARVGEVTHAERVCLARMGWTPEDPELHGWQEITHEWTRPGAERQMDGPLRRMAMRRSDPSWNYVVQELSAQGRLLVAIDSLDEPVRSEQLALGVVWTLCYPVTVEGQVWGLMGMDYATPYSDYHDTDLAALQTVATTIADAILRRTLEQRALSIERARADENARLLGRVQRHAVLLDAVARAAEILLAAPTPDQGIERVLEILCAATQSDRVCYAHFEFTPDDPELLGWRHITHEWNRPGAARKMASALRRYPMRRSTADWEDKLARLSSTGWIRQRVVDLPEPYRGELQGLGVDWFLRFSIFSGDRVVALLGFDCSGPYDDFEDATIDALQIVGSAISDALWRHELEQKAIATERARADENARLASLLAQVVASSRLLIDVEPQAFEPAMLAWLGIMGNETRAMRATFYDLAPFPANGHPTLRMLCEWVRDGVTGSVPCSFAEPYVIDPSGAEEVIAELTSGRVLAVHTDDTRGPMREFLESQGNVTVVAVPVFVGGRQWGAVSFDFNFRREIGSADAAVLQTAADTLSAVLRRNDTATALLAEREARLQAEQQRSSELARANGSLRRALDALAGSDGAAAFLRDVLVQLQLQTGARTAYLFSIDDDDGRLHIVGRASTGAFSNRPAPDDPPMFSRGFEMHAPLMAVLKPLGRFLWRRVDLTTPLTSETLEITRWHLTQRHQANAVHALMVGERQVGFIGMVFDSPEPLSKVQLDLAHALSQPITLALELTRLSRLAQRGGEQAAMLKERNRLAREIHDGIAQSFLAIQMQLDLLDEGAASHPPIQKAMGMARHGLNEARRAVAALRPQDLQSGDLPGAIERLLALAERSDGTRTELVRPGAWTPLPAEVEDHLFRIVQEAVNNSLRHARASHIKVELSQAAGEATLLVGDDGVGFDPERLARHRGFGLESMQQRAQLIGARIDWMTQPGQGTQLLLSWSATAPHSLQEMPPPRAPG